MSLRWFVVMRVFRKRIKWVCRKGLDTKHRNIGEEFEPQIYNIGYVEDIHFI